jgi:hypothetical protein
MMIDLLESIESQLQEEESRISERLEGLKAECGDLEFRLASVAEARAKLFDVTGKKGRKTRAKATTKPSPTKADVLEAVMSLLTDNRPAMPYDDLRSLAESKIVERGLSRSVFGLMFKKALRSPQIKEVGPGLCAMSGAVGPTS